MKPSRTPRFAAALEALSPNTRRAYGSAAAGVRADCGDADGYHRDRAPAACGTGRLTVGRSKTEAEARTVYLTPARALRAALVLEGIDFPFTHDLNALRNLLPDSWPVRADLADLTGWVVQARYPGE